MLSANIGLVVNCGYARTAIFHLYGRPQQSEKKNKSTAVQNVAKCLLTLNTQPLYEVDVSTHSDSYVTECISMEVYTQNMQHGHNRAGVNTRTLSANQLIPNVNCKHSRNISVKFVTSKRLILKEETQQLLRILKG